MHAGSCPMINLAVILLIEPEVKGIKFKEHAGSNHGA